MESSKVQNKHKLIKNTLVLYLRMILILGISLYSSRLVLSILGVTDYGVYNVVAGVVLMLGALSSSLSGATSRFLTIELGKNSGELKKVFRCCATVHYILALIVLIIGETIGLWFVTHKLVIPTERMNDAIWVYQFALATIIIKIINTPYSAIIIAYEKMKTFAFISLFESILQLGLIFLLLLIPNNKLLFYGLFIAFTQLCVISFYQIYCKRHIEGPDSKWLWDKKISFAIFKFSGWTLLGSGAVMGYTQGINILLNLFFGPVANAARSLSYQINAGITQISYNLQLALRPATIKSYAQDNYEEMQKLMIINAKYSYFLVLIIVIPVIVNTPFLLKLWLSNVPEYTVGFTRLTLLGTLYATLNGHVITAIHATGDLKKFQIIEGGLLLLTVPVAYILLRFYHLTANGVIIVYLCIEFITQFIRVIIVYPKVKMNIIVYFKKICLPLLLVSIPLIILTLGGIKYYSADSFKEFLINTIFYVITSVAIIYFVGLSKYERTTMNCKIHNIVNNYL